MDLDSKGVQGYPPDLPLLVKTPELLVQIEGRALSRHQCENFPDLCIYFPSDWVPTKQKGLDHFFTASLHPEDLSLMSQAIKQKNPGTG